MLPAITRSLLISKNINLFGEGRRTVIY
jgi:hypothetical protein